MSKTNKARKSNNKAKKVNKKKKYKVRNWKEYNEALKQRGELDVWIEESVLESWNNLEPNFGPGRQTIYSDAAIQLTLQFGKVFGQKLRQTEGLVQYFPRQKTEFLIKAAILNKMMNIGMPKSYIVN